MVSIFKWRVLALVTACIVSSGCASAPVSFMDRAHDADAQLGERRVQIFLDREGQLYPRRGLPQDLRDERPPVSLRFLRENYSDELCGSNPTEETARLCSQDWDEAQADFWRDRAELTASLLPDDRQGTLVVLIHGFNVASAAGSFQEVRSQTRMASDDPSAMVFLEVNWNGYQRSPFDIPWADAQYSAPLGGFALRRFFHELDAITGAPGKPEFPKVRVVMHSSGAMLVGGAFGNPYYALPMLHDPKRRECEPHARPTRVDADGRALRCLWYERFYDNRDRIGGPYGVPQIEDLRIAMFAPATPADTFVARTECGDEATNSGCEPAQETQGGLLTPGATVLFTESTRDLVLRKALPPGYLSRTLGATGLGTDRSEVCRLVNGAHPDADVRAIDFTPGKGQSVGFFAHSWSIYLNQPNARPMLEAMFADEAPTELPGTITC